MKDCVLVLGGTSAIAKETAKALAQKGHSFFLAGRNVSELKRIAQDLRVRYQVDVLFGRFDAEEWELHETFFQGVLSKTGGIVGVVVAFGDLGNPKGAQEDFSEAFKILNRNFIGACSILTPIANYFEFQRGGFIIGISSVAGDRGRASNYVYGAAKGGFTRFLQGLRNRLAPSGVKVLTVKPGFVDSPMTYGKEGMFAVASPEYVGKKIVKALTKSKDLIYVPWFWRGILIAACAIPEKLFKKLYLVKWLLNKK